MAIRFLTLFFILPAFCYSQKTFTLIELLRLNELREKPLTQVMHKNSFSVYNRMHDTAANVLFLSFVDKGSQKFMKRWDENWSGFTLESSFAMDFSAYRTGLRKEGFALRAKDSSETGVVTEFYEKKQQSVTLFHAAKGLDGNDVPVYSVVVSKGAGGAIARPDL